MTAAPAFARGLCDDAAVFPPGNKPLPQAIDDHLAHRAAPYRELLGPLVLPVSALARLSPLPPGEPIDLTLTAPGGPAELAAGFAAARTLPVNLLAVEVAVPAGMSVSAFAAELRQCLPEPSRELTTYLEVPRDERRDEVIDVAATDGYRAKFRTGGVRAELYPDEAELAASIAATVAAGVAFKATAGLHHAVRNTDPATGFEQHGFLNVLLAADAARDGAATTAIETILAERDASVLAAALADVDAARAAAARAVFVSFGTCDVIDPVTELVELGLLAGEFGAGQSEGNPA